MEPINVPHHVIPGSPPPLITSTSQFPQGPVTGTARAAVKTVHHTLVPHLQGVNLLPILAATGVVLGGLALTVLLLRTVKAYSLRKYQGELSDGSLGRLSHYAYQGLKAVLRRIFLSLRERISQTLGVPLETATPRELARLLGNESALAFAKRYEALMYGLDEPGEADVAYLEGMAEKALRPLKGREHG